MKSFLKKIMCFFPIIIIIAIINVSVDPANIYKEQYEKKAAELILLGENVVGMTNYDERLLQKEIILNEAECPETIILGSSRVMTLSKNAIGIEKFRNHGVSGAGIFDYMGILGLYKECDKMPQQIIIGLDPWILNKNNGETRYQTIWQYIEEFEKILNGKEEKERKISSRNFEKEVQLLSISYFQNSVKELLRNPCKVWKNIVENNYDFYGTKEENVDEMICYADGSIEYNKEFREVNVDTTNANAKKYVSENIYQIENYEELELSYCVLLERIVDYLKTQGVHITFYLPPYHPYVFQYLMDNSKYESVFCAEKYFNELAERKGIKVYGSYNPNLMGCVEEDFLDGMHLRRSSMNKIWLEYDFLFKI